MLVVMLRLRLREVPAFSPLAPPLPRLFMVAPFELKAPRPLLRLATGAASGAPSSEEDEDGDSSRAVLWVVVSLLRCSRKSSTTCCRRLLVYFRRFRGATTPPDLTPKNSFRLACLFRASAYQASEVRTADIEKLLPPHAGEEAKKKRTHLTTFSYLLNYRQQQLLHLGLGPPQFL